VKLCHSLTAECCVCVIVSEVSGHHFVSLVNEGRSIVVYCRRRYYSDMMMHSFF